MPRLAFIVISFPAHVDDDERARLADIARDAVDTAIGKSGATARTLDERDA
jgi:hypothetical protein